MPSGSSPRELRRLFRTATKLMPPDGGFDAWLAALGSSRGRPLVVVDHEFEPGFSGVVVSVADSDLIFVAADAAPSQRAMIICHELAHLLLGHSHGVDDHDLDSLTPTLTDVVPDLDPAISARVLAARAPSDSPAEIDAEHLGTLLAIEHGRRQRLHGDPRGSRLR